MNCHHGNTIKTKSCLQSIFSYHVFPYIQMGHNDLILTNVMHHPFMVSIIRDDPG